jgi:hypothetical protein
MSGVIGQEQARQESWSNLGLADPIRVMSAEATAKRLYDCDWKHPARVALDAFFEQHPEVEKPNGWEN